MKKLESVSGELLAQLSGKKVRTLQPVANDLITELREALEGLLGQADLGEVDEETQPIVMRAKSAVMRAEREESALLVNLKRLVFRIDGVDGAPSVGELEEARAAIKATEGTK